MTTTVKKIVTSLQGSLLFRVEGVSASSFGDEEIEELTKQCEHFFTKRLEEAVTQAFGDV